MYSCLLMLLLYYCASCQPQRPARPPRRAEHLPAPMFIEAPLLQLAILTSVTLQSILLRSDKRTHTQPEACNTPRSKHLYTPA